MSSFKQGAPVYGRDLTPSATDQDWTVVANVTTTTYTAGAPEVGAAFTAPTSGKALVCISAGIRNNAATNERIICSFRVFEDDPNGILFLDVEEDNGIKSGGVASSGDFRYCGNSCLVTGMSPGRQYYFQVVHRSINGAGTADISSRSILVIAQP